MGSVNAKEELKAAAKQLEEHGWKQGGYGVHPDGECCAAGAVLQVEQIRIGKWIDAGRLRQFDTLPGKAIKRLSRYLRSTGRSAREVPKEQDHHDVVVHWNDAQGRTKTEVLEALAGAAERKKDWT